MLIHRCSECGKISINRIAADDIAESLFGLFANALQWMVPHMQSVLSKVGSYPASWDENLSARGCLGRNSVSCFRADSYL